MPNAVHALNGSGSVAESDGPDDKPWLLYSPGRRAAFLIVLFMVGASNNIDRNILGVLLPQIKIEFHLSDTELGLLSGIAFAFFYATLGIPLARLADRGDRTRVLSYSLMFWSAMTTLCGYAQTFWQLVLARIGVGAGEAGAFPPAQSLIADYFPPEKRGGAMAVWQMSAAAGYAGGLILGGFIAQHYGWRNAFIVVGVAGLLLGPICLWVLKEPRTRAVQQAAREPFRTALTELFRNPAYRCILYAIVIYYFMGYGALVFVVSLIMRLYDVNVQSAGATFGTISIIGSLTGSVLGGVLANRLSRKSMANLPRIAGWAAIACVPCYELGLMQPSLQAMYFPLLLGMTMQALMATPMFASLFLVCESNRRATAVAIALLFANLVGLGLGPFLTGLISDLLAPAYGTAESLRRAIMILFVVLFAGGAFMLRAARYIETSPNQDGMQTAR